MMPAAAMVRQAEIDAAYLAVEASRADPTYQAELQAKATASRERAHRMRAELSRTISYKAGGVSVDIGAPEAHAERVE
jgi:hypothetical protein